MDLIWILLIWAGGMIGVMYFLTIRPAKVKNEKMRAMHDALAIGDEVTTVGGVFAKVTARDGDTITLLIDEDTGTKIRVTVYAIAAVNK